MRNETAVYGGVVKGLSGGAPVGRASERTYKVSVGFPDGPRVLSLRIAHDIWPDELDTEALKTGTAVLVAVTKGQVQLIAVERPHFAPCPSPSPGFSAGSLVGLVARMTPTEKEALRRAMQ